MDPARCLCDGRSGGNRPGPRFGALDREERHEFEQPVARADEPVQASLSDAPALQELPTFFRRQSHELGLERCRYGHDLPDRFARRSRQSLFPAVLARPCIDLGYVGHYQMVLGRKEAVFLKEVTLGLGQRRVAKRHPSIQRVSRLLERVGGRACLLVASGQFLPSFLQVALAGLEIGQ